MEGCVDVVEVSACTSVDIGVPNINAVENIPYVPVPNINLPKVKVNPGHVGAPGADGNAAAFRERLPAPVSNAVVLMAALMAPVRHGPSSAPSKARASGGVWAPRAVPMR
ncbi:hypothetical protein I551_5085 [Mycobacterium ulcerans str. Harvey]|uniref:Uncharacterized protein n=1 Tax=Mycobacterium ulcerans str. Harvey TaxID=1299332 RepID=A0ABN0QUI6_MYCUL|nr:hypothetical protein I551_5085 [Mycobacterium ulcerans str. Harvey]